MTLDTIANSSVAPIIGGICGGLIGALTAWFISRITLKENKADALLRRLLEIRALQEAWIVDGEGFEEAKLSANKQLPLEKVDNGLWLRRVEMRAVADEADWNTVENPFYDVIDGKKAWIIRDSLGTFSGEKCRNSKRYHPALISSYGFEELCGWIESAASAERGKLLSKKGKEMLYPLMRWLCRPDRIKVLAKGGSLSDAAIEFTKRIDRNEIR